MGEAGCIAGALRRRAAASAAKPITYRGEGLGLVFIKGSEEWKPDWQRHKGSVYFGVPDKALVDDDVYIDNRPLITQLPERSFFQRGS